MPDIPVCVIVDGEFSIEELKKCYGVLELRVSDFSDSRLPPICKGTSRTKFAAIWESPFERFLCIDSDAVVIGDWQSILKDATWQFLALANPQAACPPGEAVDFEAKHPGTFQFADQAIFNYMVMKAAAQGQLELQVANRQYLVPDHSVGESIQRFVPARQFVCQQEAVPEVVHFCGKKPLIQNRSAYSELFTEFRMRHYRNHFGTGSLAQIRAWSTIFAEEWQVLQPRLARKLFPTPR